MEWITPHLDVRAVTDWRAPGAQHQGRRGWTLLAPYRYANDALEVDHTLPEGFWWDGASVPAAFQGIVNPTGGVFPGSAFHDDFYGARRFLRTGDPVTRALADLLFLRVNLLAGCPPGEARAAYLAVRAGGHEAWYRYHPEDRPPPPEPDPDP